MKYTRSAITQLTRWYKQVLIKCAYLNAAILAGAIMVPTAANAQTNIKIDNTGEGTATYTAGVATTSYLHATSPANPDQNYTDWVVSPLNDTVTMDGGSLTTSGLTQNGALYAKNGDINVQSGSLAIANGSYINSPVSLAVASGARLNISGTGSVVLSNNDNISGIINAAGGTLDVAGGTHTLTNESVIASGANFKIESGATVIMNSYLNFNTAL